MNSMVTTPEYLERVYAGTLGKIIGVYLGRPFEGWDFQRIEAELGEIHYYVHDRLGLPLVVTDDDLAGTFTFIRALPDYDCDPDLTPAQVGQTWLNYLIENRTVLWWGGMGNSTEHTAYLRLKRGYTAPSSGSMEVNGRLVSEQIGAQIFIDGWAMICPGDPERAADFARRAARVSHDGEAVNAACVLAAMEAHAFVETRIDSLIEMGLAQIPAGSTIYRAIQDVREWHAADGDWRKTRQRIFEKYGVGEYSGVCHVVPNHALITNALLYGEGDFQTSLMIVNTSGQDTDCNSGNLGCLLGIRSGLEQFRGPVDWRGPVADRLFISSADGGRAITDAVQETVHLVNIARSLAGAERYHPKAGARFHFELPGSVQGFSVDRQCSRSAGLENVEGYSVLGKRSLAIHYTQNERGCIRVSTPTFIPPEAIDMPGYNMEACPSLYLGQQVKMGVLADPNNRETVAVCAYLQSYGPQDELVFSEGPTCVLGPGDFREITWKLPADLPQPVAFIGLEIRPVGLQPGTVYLDSLTWDGSPEVALTRPSHGGRMWERAWVHGVDRLITHFPEAMRIVQNEGTGLLIQGCREWENYRVEACLTPHLWASGGIAARVQGMKRYYALQLRREGKIELVKAYDGLKVLADRPYAWEPEQAYRLALEVNGRRITGWVNDQMIFEFEDHEHPLENGAAAFVCEEGCLSARELAIKPLR